MRRTHKEAQEIDDNKIFAVIWWERDEYLDITEVL